MISSSRYFYCLLTLIGVFILGFFLMGIVAAVVVKGFNLDIDSRDCKLILSVVQAVCLFIIPALLCASLFPLITRQQIATLDSPATFLGLSRAPGWLPVCGVIFAYLIAIPALNQLIYWNSTLTFPDSLADWGDTFVEMEQKAQDSSQTMIFTTSVGSMLVNLLVVALVTAFAEEIFFRGALQNTIALKASPYTAIWIVAFIFSAAHFQVFGFVPRLLLGAWFGYLLVWTKSLYVPIIAHTLNNAVVVLFTWLAARGVNFNFEMLGVAPSGFPLAATVSFVAFVIFITCFRKFFFYREMPDSSSPLPA